MGIHIPGAWPSLAAISLPFRSRTSAGSPRKNKIVGRSIQKKRKRSPSPSQGIFCRIQQKIWPVEESPEIKGRKRKAEHSVDEARKRPKPQRVRIQQPRKDDVKPNLPAFNHWTDIHSPADPDLQEPEAEAPSLLETNTFAKIRLLGESSFGIVYLMQSNTTHELYASKVFREPAVSRGPSSFPGEVKVLKAIKRKGEHPNIIRFQGAEITHRLQVRMMMDYCNAGDLFDQVYRFKEMGIRAPPQFALHAFIQCCEGLAWLHHGLRFDGADGYKVDDNFTEGFLHGDIKPENILLHRDRKNVYGMPTLVICDFSHGSPVSRPRSNVGTPKFFSPEARAHYHNQGDKAPPIGTPHDVYAMALTLYNLLWDAYWPVGRHPRSLRVPPELEDLELERMLSAMLQPKPNARADLTLRSGGILCAILDARRLRDEIYDREGPLEKKLWKTV